MGLVDPKLLPMKAHYYLFNAGKFLHFTRYQQISKVQSSPNVIKKMHFCLSVIGTAPVVPFIPVYAKQLGYSAKTVGFIYVRMDKIYAD